MAKQTIPDPLKRRHLIEEDVGAKRALAIAEAYLADDRPSEAIIFLEQAEASDRLAELREQAITAGDVFLLKASSAALGAVIDAETWVRVAKAAEGAGKALYAHEAHRQAGLQA